MPTQNKSWFLAMTLTGVFLGMTDSALSQTPPLPPDSAPPASPDSSDSACSSNNNAVATYDSANPCTADFSGAIAVKDSRTAGCGSSLYHVQAGGILSGGGAGSVWVAVDNGGVVNGTGGGGSWVVFVKAGGNVNLTDGGGNHTVYYEGGATVMPGSNTTQVFCSAITLVESGTETTGEEPTADEESSANEESTATTETTALLTGQQFIEGSALNAAGSTYDLVPVLAQLRNPERLSRPLDAQAKDEALKYGFRVVVPKDGASSSLPKYVVFNAGLTETEKTIIGSTAPKPTVYVDKNNADCISEPEPASSARREEIQTLLQSAKTPACDLNTAVKAFCEDTDNPGNVIIEMQEGDYLEESSVALCSGMVLRNYQNQTVSVSFQAEISAEKWKLASEADNVWVADGSMVKDAGGTAGLINRIWLDGELVDYAHHLDSSTIAPDVPLALHGPYIGDIALTGDRGCGGAGTHCRYHVGVSLFADQPELSGERNRQRNCHYNILRPHQRCSFNRHG